MAKSAVSCCTEDINIIMVESRVAQSDPASLIQPDSSRTKKENIADWRRLKKEDQALRNIMKLCR